MKVKLNNVRAFTLIEMILAIGIAALVLIAINAVFFTALHLRDATQTLVDESTPVQQTFTTLRRDLECATPPQPNGILSGDFKAGNVSSAGISQPVAVEMYTATGTLSENAPWGDIQKVTYELKNPTDQNSPGKDLIRSVTRNLLTMTTPEMEDQWMMSGVESIQFSCFDGVQWDNTWDTTAVTSANTNLPVAVRVEIQTVATGGNARPQPIEIFVPIDSQWRTNS